MKKYIDIYIIGLLLFLAACYDDKGNYSYSDINEITFTITPASEGEYDHVYIFAQPQEDSLQVSLSPEVQQTLQNGDDNLHFTWIRQWTLKKKTYKDTLYTKTCMFSFPPEIAMTYSVLLILRDESNGQEIYKNLTLKTIVPYTRSWLILHGKENDRKIGALEYDATKLNVQRVETDIYNSLKGSRRFQNAFAIKYGSFYNSDLENGDKLYVLERDKITWIYPFNCNEKAATAKMMPGGWNAHFLSCVTNWQSRFGIICDNGKYYHNGAFGYFYEAEAEVGATDYHADRAYLSEDSYVTLWDNMHKRFLYYGSNWYSPWEDSRVDISNFDARIVNFTPEDLKGFDLTDCQLLWIGKGLTNQSKNGASALLKNTAVGAYYMMNIGYGGKDKSFSLYDSKDKGEGTGFVNTEVVSLQNADFSENTIFTSTGSFSNQLFYSQGADLYLYNIISGESNFLYSVGAGRTITHMAFRQEERGSMDTDFWHERILGIAAVTADGQGEFHEVVLDEAADVSQSASFKDFGPIVDFCYSYLSHAFYD